MKIATLLSASVLAIALGLTAAQAQAPGDMNQGGPPAAAPGAGGPAGGAPDIGPGGPSAGGMKEDLGAPGLTGPKGDRPGLSAEGQGNADMKSSGKAGKQAEGEAGAKGKVGAEAEGDVGVKGKAGAEAEGDVGAKGEAGAEAEGDLDASGKARGKAEGDIGADGKTGATAEGEKTGKPGKSVRLESQQITKVKTYFSQHRPSVKAIDKTEISVSVGIALPTTIVLYDLPPDVIVVGGPCPIKYFVWGDDVVLVDSCSREVVEIIVGVA